MGNGKFQEGFDLELQGIAVGQPNLLVQAVFR